VDAADFDDISDTNIFGAFEYGLSRWRIGPDDTLAELSRLDENTMLICCEQIVRRTCAGDTVRAVLLHCLALASAYVVESRALMSAGEFSVDEHRAYCRHWAVAAGELLLDKIGDTIAEAARVGC
jgi:hypothetical protein